MVKRVYLSPSNQTANTYSYGNTTEAVQCGRIAEYCRKALLRSSVEVMVRRQFPKGTDFDKVTAAEVKRVETWLNNYPREILGFMSSAQAFELAFDRAA